MTKVNRYFKLLFSDIAKVFGSELKAIFTDAGVLIFFVLVPLAYPLVYAFIYTNEVVREVPVAVVDDSRSTLSSRFMRKVDATADVSIVSHCANMDEARSMVKHREAYGIVYIPEDFSNCISTGKQTQVSIFVDMSGMLYYKALLTAATNVSLDMNADIKVARAGNSTRRQEEITEHPISYRDIGIFNPQNGFAAFLIPAVLVLIIQQTLLLGVGMSAGTLREKGLSVGDKLKAFRPQGVVRMIIGKMLAYACVYVPVSIYVLGVVPRIFKLNQIGSLGDLAVFCVPLLLACIFFAMAVSAFIRHRETCMLVIVFTSVPLLFMSGISWPGAAIPAFWKYFSYVFPSTFGVNGFVRINNMGATLADVATEYYALWGLALAYFAVACIAYRKILAKKLTKFK